MPGLERLSPASADLARRTLRWCDTFWDEERGLPRVPDAAGYSGPGVPEGTLHLVPQSAWLAFGLLLRRDPETRDVERALRILRELVALQYDKPGKPWHGSFARFAESPVPRKGAVEWLDYDPNWRQFLGTAFIATLHCFGPLLPDELVDALDEALVLTVEGEPPDRVAPSYSNIALLRAFLEVEVGARGGRLEWVSRGEALARAVGERFDRHGVFEEYNSPTYYGLDLFALALWRGLSSSPWLRNEGSRLEAALWRDVARWYHPGLRNLCGPYSRTYGMDMNAYVSLLGLWIWAGLGPECAPLPPLEPDAEHGHDFFLGSLVAVLGAAVPEVARGAFAGAVSPRTVRQRISDEPSRTATATFEPGWMAGAEESTLDLSGWEQYVAVTLHWRHPGGEVAWLAVRAPGPSQARAVKSGLRIEWPAPERADGEGPLVVRIRARGVAESDFSGDRWRLPGLELGVETVLELDALSIRPSGAKLSFRRPRPGTSAGLGLRVIEERR
ncbi:MAG: hypothetical protein ACQGVK_18240 [Myxococcota bacterium]